MDIIGDKMTSGLVWSSRDTLLCAVAKTSCSDDKNALITTNSEGNSYPIRVCAHNNYADSPAACSLGGRLATSLAAAAGNNRLGGAAD